MSLSILSGDRIKEEKRKKKLSYIDSLLMYIWHSFAYKNSGSCEKDKWESTDEFLITERRRTDGEDYS